MRLVELSQKSITESLLGRPCIEGLFEIGDEVDDGPEACRVAIWMLAAWVSWPGHRVQPPNSVQSQYTSVAVDEPEEVR